MAKSEEETTNRLSKRITRRQVVKAGGLAAAGLVFSKPIIETLSPKPVWAQYGTGQTNTGGGGGGNLSLIPTQIQSVSDDPTEVAGSGAGALLVAKNGFMSRALLKFSIPGIEGGPTVQSATITMLAVPLMNSTDITVHAITNDWTVGATTTFTNPGHNAAVLDSNTVDTATIYTWTITALVQSWIDNPSSNFGVLFKGDEAGAISYEIGFGPPILLDIVFS